MAEINSYTDCPSRVTNKTACVFLVVGTNMYLATSTSNVFNIDLITQKVPLRAEEIFVCFKLSICWVTSSVKDLAESRLEFVYHILECVQRKITRVITNKKKLSRESLKR